MRGKWLTRFIFVGVVGLGLWLAKALTDSPQLEIRERSRAADESPNESMRGEGLVYRQYDLQGNEKMAVQAERGLQMADEAWQLNRSVAELVTKSGKRVTFSSDAFRDDADGNRIIESNSDQPIRVRDDEGLTFETVGPLILWKDREFRTDAKARFHWGASKGHTQGIFFRPDERLEFDRDVVFEVELDEQDARIVASSLVLDMPESLAEITSGRATVLSEGGHEIGLRSDRMIFFYLPDAGGAPSLLQEFQGIGEGTRMSWRSGQVESDQFSLCFGPGGRWVQLAQSGGSASFSFQTEDHYRLSGTTGRIEVGFQFGEPSDLVSGDHVRARGVDGKGVEFRLEGDGGIASTFEGGHAIDTLILGMPRFSYQDMEGDAGSIRLIHREGRILLSGGATLRDGQDVVIEGEEILIANWNRDEKEVFARSFVRCVVLGDEAPDVVGSGDNVRIVFPQRRVELVGSPAEFRQGVDTLRADRVVVEPQEDGRRILLASGSLKFDVDLGEELAHAEAESMSFDESQGVASFRLVRQVRLPSFGEVSAHALDLRFGPESRDLREISGEGDVIIQGSVESDGQTRPFSCQADRFQFDAKTELVVLQGIESDVVFHFDEGQVHRSRELTFNMRDGSMHAGSDTHEFTKTILNIKDLNEGDD